MTSILDLEAPRVLVTRALVQTAAAHTYAAVPLEWQDLLDAECPDLPGDRCWDTLIVDDLELVHICLLPQSHDGECAWPELEAGAALREQLDPIARIARRAAFALGRQAVMPPA